MTLPASDRRQFKIGKYDVVAQPALGSAQMLRYTVLLDGRAACWGSGTEGALGSTAMVDRPAPAHIVGDHQFRPATTP